MVSTVNESSWEIKNYKRNKFPCRDKIEKL